MFSAFGFPTAMLWISALVLLAGFLEKIPAVGKYIAKFAKWLAGFGLIIGILDIIAALPF
jgi:cadmium resistance protein CadD (predicted permease)